jgi:hypothetical protein
MWRLPTVVYCSHLTKMKMKMPLALFVVVLPSLFVKHVKEVLTILISSYVHTFQTVGFDDPHLLRGELNIVSVCCSRWRSYWSAHEFGWCDSSCHVTATFPKYATKYIGKNSPQHLLPFACCVIHICITR